MITPDLSVARAVLDHSECAAVFQRHRIDFCCQGSRSIEEACRARGLDPDAIVAELRRAIAERRGAPGPDVASLPVQAVVELVVSTHHAYLRRTLPFVAALAAKVGRVHGDRDPRLVALDAAVRELVGAVEPHLDAEEDVLFPALVAPVPDLAVIRRELATMHQDHLEVGALLARIRELTGDFRTPDWACTSYRTLFSELEQLEGDTLRHVHIENHVLMPRFA